MAGLPALARELRLYPSRLALEQAVVLGPGQAVTTDGAHTFASLVDLLATARPGGRLLRPLAGRLLVREALAGGPEPLRALAGDPVAVRATHDAFLELRGAGLVADKLLASHGSAALHAVARALGRYERMLADRGLVDVADCAREAVLAVAERRLPPSLAAVERVVVVGEGQLLGARLDLLNAWASLGVQVRVTIPYDAERPAAFAWPEASLHALEARGVHGVEVVGDARLGSGALRPLRAAQWTSAVVSAAPVSVVHAPGAREQARQIAAQVARWCDQGVAAKEIVVALADDALLGPHVLRELSRHGVAAYARRGPRLDEVPQVASLLGALRLADHQFPREALLDAWRSFGDHSALRHVASEVRRAGARTQRVQPFREALLERARREAPRRSGRERAEKLHGVAQVLESFIHGLSALPERASWRAHLDALASLLELLVWRSPQGELPEVLEHAALRGAQAAGLMAEELAELDAALELGGDSELSRREFLDTVAMALAERELSGTGARAVGVRVTTLAELCGARFSRVVIGGVDGESFPRRAVPSLVLTEELRLELNARFDVRLLASAPAAGRGRLSPDARDTWLWQEALAVAQDELVVIYGVADGEERYGRSAPVEELLRSLGREEPQAAPPLYCDVEQRAELRALEVLAFGELSTSPGVAAKPAGAGLEALCAKLRAHSGPAVRWLELRRDRDALLGLPTGQPALLRDADLAVLGDFFLKRVHNVSALDAIGTCSFRHFAGSVLALERDSVPPLGVDARDDGTAKHAALRAVYSAIMANGGLAAACKSPDATWQAARRAFDQAVPEVLGEISVHPALRSALLEDVWNSVREQLASDMERADGFEPVALEWRFAEDGQASAPVLELRHPVRPDVLKVRGTIDRLDRAGAQLLTLDYKRTVKPREPGRHFQLGIYTAAALRAHAGVGEVGSAWVSLKDRKRKVDDYLASEPATFEAQLARDLWSRVDRSLRGEISPDPQPLKQCESCDFWALCRYPVELVDPSGEGDR